MAATLAPNSLRAAVVFLPSTSRRLMKSFISALTGTASFVAFFFAFLWASASAPRARTKTVAT